MGPGHRLMSMYSVVKDLRRGKRQGRDEPRAQESSARVYGSVAASGISDEAKAPKSIIPEGKKGIRGLMIVFMEIRAVTGFVEEILTRKNGGLSGIICRNKVTGEMRPACACE